MQNDWIIDVLADLNRFARDNGYRQLAAQLEEAAVVASVELASQAGGSAIVGDAGIQAGHGFPAVGAR